MTPRSKKWWLIGAAAWLACSVAPALLFLIDDWESGFPFLWLSASGGLGVLSAILIRPRPPRWLWGAITLIWCFGWIYWVQLVWEVAETIVVVLEYYSAIAPSRGFMAYFGYELAVTLILSCFITTILLTLLTRSWRVFLLTLIPAALFGAAWAFGFDAPWVDMIWHPIVIGALIHWAVPKRIHPFPAHACQSCGYDLRGLEPDAKCPECGSTRLSPGAMAQPDEVR